MIKRSLKDRRSDTKKRANIGRRKDERYSIIAYRLIILIVLTIICVHISLVLINLK